jgi:hypothetical protein
MSGDLKEDHSTVSPSSYCLFFQHAGRISAGKDPLHPAQRRYEDREAEKIKEDVQEGSSAPKKNFKCWFSRILIGLWETRIQLSPQTLRLPVFRDFTLTCRAEIADRIKHVLLFIPNGAEIDPILLFNKKWSGKRHSDRMPRVIPHKHGITRNKVVEKAISRAIHAEARF